MNFNSTLRGWIAGIFTLGVVGAGVELLLLGHTEDRWQLVPLVLIGASLLALGGFVASRSRASLWTFRLVAMLFVASGLAGLWLHYQANVEFELEMYPSMSGLELVKESLTGAIPALAPGAMVQLGLLGWVYTWRHPAVHDDDDHV